MKKGVAEPVGIKPVAQVVPRADLVDRLVLDQLLQEGGRRIPGDLLQVKHTDVKPGPEQVFNIEGKLVEPRVLPHPGKEGSAHVN